MPSWPFSPFGPYGREFREAMPFRPLLWRLAMPSGPFSPFGPYGRKFREAMPFSPLLWHLAMPSGPFRLFRPSSLRLLSLSRMGHYGQTRTPKTGTVHRTMHSPICFRNILVESLVESVSHECPQMSSLSRSRKWDTLAAWK